MASYSPRQHTLSLLQKAGNRSALGVILWITLLKVFLSTSAQAATFTVNSPLDVVDASPGNGVCETAPGNGLCTLRAAIEEANALAGDDTIILPPNTSLQTLVNELTITDDVTINGGGASTTIINGNKSVRPDSGVLVVVPGITVSIGGVTVRNGQRVDGGGGIANSGILILTNSTVSGNNSLSGHNGASGGGILNTRYCASLGGKAAIARRASLVVQGPPFGNAGTAATCIGSRERTTGPRSSGCSSYGDGL